MIRREVEARPAWMDAPVMASSFGTPDLTVGIDSFRSGLAAHTPPPAFLAPLGHLVSADAPSGTVTGLAQPITTVSRSVAARVDDTPLPIRPAPSDLGSSRNGNTPRVQRWPARNGSGGRRW